MEPFKPYSFEELRLADYGKIQKSNTSSKEFFGLPTAPATPQPEPEESIASSSIQYEEEEDTKTTPFTGSLFSSDLRTDAAASRSFFGLSTTPAVPHPEIRQIMKSDRKAQSAFSFGSNMEPGTQNAQTDSQSRSSRSPGKSVNETSPESPSGMSTKENKPSKFRLPTTGTEAPSLFSTLPISPWNVKDTNANPCLRPKLSDAQSASLFSSLPKTAAITSFAPSTVLDYPAGRHHCFKTSSFSFSNALDMPKDVSTMPTSVQKRNIASIKRTKTSFGFSAPPITTSSSSSSSSTMGNVLPTDQPPRKAATTEQGIPSVGYNPFESFATLAATIPQSVQDTIPEKLKPERPAFKFENVPSSLSFVSRPQPVSGERQKYMSLHHTKDNKTSGADEQLRTTPLLSLSVKETSEARKTGNSSMFPQYAFLGCRISDTSALEDDDKNENLFLESEPVLLNTNTPWSAFICGSQGSGKSYSLSAIIENCLHASPKIGKLPQPLAGVVFHNNTASAHNICEAAHLVSLGVKVNVLVSRSNYHALSSIYKKAVSPQAVHLLNIQPLVLQSYHLTAERMHRLMAFQESETAVPLYMEVIMRILREMAITGLPFNYSTFKVHLENEGLTPGQKVMMEMRLCLLESFMDPSCTRPTKSSAKKTDLFSTVPGTLTIVDLSDPFLDSSTTCTLFDILLSLFLSSRPEAGMLICLDEAHKFMKNTPAAETFTENLLTVIREQRHNACRVVIATQEPTISPKLLDLCSITMVHRFTSPDWLTTLRGHLAGASDLVTSSDDSSKKISAAKLFEKIINLDVGESLLFAPSAVLDMDGSEVKKLGTGFVKFKTRVRLGEDGGQSVLAVRH
ncbi:hypothetical protein D6C81_08861 [Aureobasidium pullulans]|nr:hypothetical protein D6C81_08861 [Aureobasidium pullulans]